MTQAPQKSLLPVICLAAGMAVGGASAAGLGVLLGRESAVVALYAIGAVGGALAGGCWGTKRVQAREARLNGDESPEAES